MGTAMKGGNLPIEPPNGRPQPAARRLQPADAKRWMFTPGHAAALVADGTCAPVNALVSSDTSQHPAALGQASAGPADDPQLAVDLGSVIADEVIPRLLLAHRLRCDAPSAALSPAEDFDPASTRLSAAEIEAFLPLPLALDTEELVDCIQRFLDRGVPVETVLVDLLAASARRLGEFWERDTTDFVEVTIALMRLQDVMRMVSWSSSAASMGSKRRPPTRPRALFTPVPGDGHSFGTLVVQEIFALGGWSSDALLPPDNGSLLAVLGGESYDLVGLTVSCDCPSGALSDLVSAIRTHSRNRSILVFLGGHAINADPRLIAEAGADGWAADASAALQLANSMVPTTDHRLAMSR